MNTHRAFILPACLALLTIVWSGIAADQKPANDQPDFAAGWRVTGVFRQGGKLQACLENAGYPARFVKEGDELVPGVLVEKIDRDKRSVTVRHEEQTAVIRTGSAPVPAVKNTALAQAPQRQSGPPRKGGPPWASGPSEAAQDDKGRWGVRNANGDFFSTQDYVKRFGGYEKAIEHSNQHLSEDTDPNRRMFHEQMLAALENERDAFMPKKKVKQKKNSRR